jgi:hypothetical protein
MLQREEEREGERETRPPAESERHSQMFLKSVGCDFRANACRLCAFVIPERTASASASRSFPWLKCGVNAGGTFHPAFLSADDR